MTLSALQSNALQRRVTLWTPKSSTLSKTRTSAKSSPKTPNTQSTTPWDSVINKTSNCEKTVMRRILMGLTIGYIKQVTSSSKWNSSSTILISKLCQCEFSSGRRWNSKDNSTTWKKKCHVQLTAIKISSNNSKLETPISINLWKTSLATCKTKYNSWNRKEINYFRIRRSLMTRK